MVAEARQQGRSSCSINDWPSECGAPRLARRSGAAVNMGHANPAARSDLRATAQLDLSGRGDHVRARRDAQRHDCRQRRPPRRSCPRSRACRSTSQVQLQPRSDLRERALRAAPVARRPVRADHRLGFASGRAPDKLAGVPHRPGALGAPVLDDCYAHFECRVANVMDTGSSTLFPGGRGRSGSRRGRPAVGSVMTAAHFRAKHAGGVAGAEYEALLQARRRMRPSGRGHPAGSVEGLKPQ